MYRKRSEAATPDLSGDDPHADQIPLSRAIPMWGAISAKGFQAMTYHKTKKLTAQEWIKTMRAGRVSAAIQKLKTSRNGPYRIICDNEGFLTAKDTRPLYRRHNIQLVPIPPRSPDLNPIERYWGWLRTQLRLRDLRDLRDGKPALGKMAYKARVKAFLKTRKA